MWAKNYRSQLWAEIEQPWDILVIGGGITGAGIFHEAVKLRHADGRPIRVLLVEQRDFAWGTSSRSSKLVHGGLRYLKEGRVFLTRASVHERQRLLHERPGLVEPLGFLISVYDGDFPGRWTFEAGLSAYDLLALRWEHRYYSPQDFQMLAPRIANGGLATRRKLKGGFRYADAQTDDARLTLQVIAEGLEAGGAAINYVSAENVLRDAHGQVCGVCLRDAVSGQSADVPAHLVISATGAWADRLRSQVSGEARIRPLRGSHLIFPAWRLPVAQAITFLHPFDNRPVFIFPWEGVTLVGTTDVDHGPEVNTSEPGINPEETAYLMAAVEAEFPALHLGLEDVISTFAGVRPVIGSGQADPSKESRDHVVWEENGLLTVTGGKLTTFQLIAHDALKAARRHLPDLLETTPEAPLSAASEAAWHRTHIGEFARRRLAGRYGNKAPALLASADPSEYEAIAGTPYVWAELRWAARAEAVVHLEDLLLRRVRLGLLLPQGGAALLGRIRQVCQAELGWEDARWEAEEAAYRKLWQECYNLPPHATIPDWKERLQEANTHRTDQIHHFQSTLARQLLAAAAGLAGIATLVFLWKLRTASSKGPGAEARPHHRQEG